MKVLLSIKPEYSQRIFQGIKTFEFRKSVFKNPEVRTVVVYETRPTAKIVGEFEVAGIISGSPADVWSETQSGAGISADFFYEYFSGRETAHAIQIGSICRYEEPLEPTEIFVKFSAPQSYMYLGASAGEAGFQPFFDIFEDVTDALPR